MSQHEGYVGADYLDLTARLLAPSKHRSYELMHLVRGYKVLDLGCGPGSDTLALSDIVGPEGEVHGVDHDAQMVAQADERARAAGVGARVWHREADAAALPWPEGFFDASRSERVLQHLRDPMGALTELVRVTRSGGWIVVLDSDWATFTIDSDEPELERRLVRFHAERRMNNPYSGRMLHRFFRSHGLEEPIVEVWPVVLTDHALARRIMQLDQIAQEAQAASVLDEPELQRWQASLDRSASMDGFFASVNGVTVAGRKPRIG
jgi:ubiquinone/menaquinone biosynthesis C-methylase UbiE